MLLWLTLLHSTPGDRGSCVKKLLQIWIFSKYQSFSVESESIASYSAVLDRLCGFAKAQTESMTIMLTVQSDLVGKCCVALLSVSDLLLQQKQIAGVSKRKGDSSFVAVCFVWDTMS